MSDLSINAINFRSETCLDQEPIQDLIVLTKIMSCRVDSEATGTDGRHAVPTVQPLQLLLLVQGKRFLTAI